MESLADLKVMTCTDRAELEAWLDEDHAGSPGVWVKLAKKGSGVASVTAAEVNDAALCFGWITGHRKSYDDVYYLQKITPRRRGSLWSKVNVDRVAELTAEGRMREPGLAEVALARADGRWDAAYESQANATVPDDLTAALDATPGARETFDGLTKSERYVVLHRLMTAKKAATRAARLERMIAALEAGDKVR
ncbi:YdeI/OmpD-associated family protein [Streptomyces sp. NBC_01381]|uniref:YdeI/OmpD-associated family protein n=1 Tax=Streptomyces sp. NBC_01381 TaxID=2903845 RepID=UPI00225ACF95|nr:YdeI/OmpD-associated family protein [Streptomyces sp. NBC_01381]MCX4671008.1 YdeI/OmpD-associated family protein [Streptomyces sp. NBC_01381]